MGRDHDFFAIGVYWSKLPQRPCFQALQKLAVFLDFFDNLGTEREGFELPVPRVPREIRRDKLGGTLSSDALPR
jgi:hypothetical protein